MTAKSDSAQFSPDGRRIVTASADKAARVWDAQSGKQLTEKLNHDGEVRSADFSPDGKRIVTISVGRTARIWDIPPPNAKTAPDWLPRLAEAVAGQRLNDLGFFDSLTEDPSRGP